MVLYGLGMGFTSAPATEAIMGVVPAARGGAALAHGVSLAATHAFVHGLSVGCIVAASVAAAGAVAAAIALPPFPLRARLDETQPHEAPTGGEPAPVIEAAAG